MRDIRFRAWDKKEKKMYYSTPEHTVWVGGRETSISGEDCPHKNISYDETMQFTGLLDKNGKEIYEGDICRWGGGVGKENIGSPIVFEFHKYFFGIRCYGKDVDDICEKCGKETGQKKHILEKSDNVYLPDSFDGEERCNGFEVIGNIYENSELLK